MTIKEIRNLPNKATIKSFQGRIANGSAPKDPTAQQQRFGEHVQKIMVADSNGDEIEVHLMRTLQHLSPDCVDRDVVFEANDDKDGRPIGLKVEKWTSNNGQECCILSVDSKHGARTYLMDGTPEPVPVERLEDKMTPPVKTTAPQGEAEKTVSRLHWCWDQVDWVEDDGIRQKLATTLWIELNMRKIEIPVKTSALPTPTPLPEMPARACEVCGDDLGHGPGPCCSGCTIEAMVATEPKPIEAKPPPEPDPVAEAAEALDSEALKSGELTPEFITLRDELMKKYTVEAFVSGFEIIAEANAGDVKKTCEQILKETKEFRELLFEISDTNDQIPF